MKKLLLGLSGVMLTVGAAWVVAQETLPAAGQAQQQPTIEQQYSYAIGLDIGKRFREHSTSLDLKKLVEGLEDGLGGAKQKLSQQSCDQAMIQLSQMMMNKASIVQKAFLDKNKTKEGVKVTKSGLQYKVIKPGTGKTPGPTDTVKCNYRGTLIDGTEFDASINHGGPATFPVNGVIPGWIEALQMMKVGAKWQLFIPAELAYGNSPPGPPIQPGSTLIFDIELLGIE